MLPAILTAKMSPICWSKRVLAGTRVSIHPKTTANGACAFEVARTWESRSQFLAFPETNRWLPKSVR